MVRIRRAVIVSVLTSGVVARGEPSPMLDVGLVADASRYDSGDIMSGSHGLGMDAGVVVRSGVHRMRRQRPSVAGTRVDFHAEHQKRALVIEGVTFRFATRVSIETVSALGVVFGGDLVEEVVGAGLDLLGGVLVEARGSS